MTNILITITAIAAYFTIQSLIQAVRTMRYHQLKARQSCMTLTELREDLDRQYYAQNMRETYDRNKL